MKELVKSIKERLYKYIHLRFEVGKLNERLARLQSEEQFPTRPEGNGGGSGQPNKDRMANAIIRRIEYQEKNAANIEAINAELDALDDAINGLEEPLEREVLRLRYTDGKNNRHMEWKDVAISIYGNDDEKHIKATHRLHGSALVSIAKLINSTETKESER